MRWRSTMVKRSPGATAAREDWRSAWTLTGVDVCADAAAAASSDKANATAIVCRFTTRLLKHKPRPKARFDLVRSNTSPGFTRGRSAQRRRGLNPGGAAQNLGPQRQRQQVRMHHRRDALVAEVEIDV